jgi:polyisoprenoid-binding protein YceI
MAGSQGWKTFVGIGAAVLLILIGVLAYSLFRTPEAATGPIEAIPLAQSTTTSTESPAATTEAAATTAPAEAVVTTEPAATTEAAETPAETVAPEATAAEPAAETAAPAAASAPVVLQIVQEESEARFVIDEVLNGAPKTVIGVTNQVAGELEVNPSDPTQSRVGVIQVNARTLETDSGMRNRTIANRILNTDQYEFITFTPTSLVGLPSSGAVGQSYTFQIIGDLTIRDVTNEVTFDVTLTPASETRLEGTATSTINYADFNIVIPSVPQVASVDEDVRLELEFVATAS